MWPLTVTSEPWPMCTHYHDEGYVFLVNVPAERDWYHSLHTSTLLPLHALLAYRRHLGPHSIHGYRVALLPAVENYGLQVSLKTCFSVVTIILLYRVWTGPALC